MVHWYNETQKVLYHNDILNPFLCRRRKSTRVSNERKEKVKKESHKDKTKLKVASALLNLLIGSLLRNPSWSPTRWLRLILITFSSNYSDRLFLVRAQVHSAIEWTCRDFVSIRMPIHITYDITEIEDKKLWFRNPNEIHFFLSNTHSCELTLLTIAPVRTSYTEIEGDFD